MIAAVVPGRRPVKEQLHLRALGRELSDWRDAEVFSELASDLRISAANRGDQLALGRIVYQCEGALRGRRVATTQLSHTCAEVAETKARFADIAESSFETDSLTQGIAALYGKARRARKRYQSAESIAELHRWRRRTKDLQYALEFSQDIGLPVSKGWLNDLNQLARVLGQAHDLAELLSLVGSEGDGALTPEFQRRQQGRVRRSVARARTIGERCFREKRLPGSMLVKEARPASQAVDSTPSALAHSSD
jgi:CHAD domain-containing protein